MAERVVVGLSGGVDSAVSAWLLKKAGYEVIGMFMKNWEDDDDSQYCSSRQDWLDAVSVADVIGIDIEAVNFAKEYKDRVFAAFLREYQAGRTPNPDILCNSEIKFKAFLEYAMTFGVEKIATGHYARLAERDGVFSLLRGVDEGKDQSYFLHRLNQSQLSKSLFPIGAMHKQQVRKLALEIGLPNAKKRDSTGICFIGERPFQEFLQRYLPTQPGPIQNVDGKVIGQHQGLSFYTLGQRKGLYIGGQRGATEQPWFVVGKDLQSNILTVAQGHQHPRLLSQWLVTHDFHWIEPAPSLITDSFSAKTRYRQTDHRCTLEQAGQGLRMNFPEPQWAVTPGQSAVLYQGDTCLGGGIIGHSQQT